MSEQYWANCSAYIYIYVERERERGREGGREGGRSTQEEVDGVLSPLEKRSPVCGSVKKGRKSSE